MTWLLAMSGWLVASLLIGVWLGKAIHRADQAEQINQRRKDEVEQRRRERMRRALEKP